MRSAWASAASSLAALAVFAGAAQAAGFDCRKARAEDEVAICRDAELSKLDDEMTAAFKKLFDTRVRYEPMSVQVALRDNQKVWLRQRERCGATVDCLRERYRERTAWLSHPLQAYTGSYENERYRLFITMDRNLKPTVRLFRGLEGENLLLMENPARFVPAKEADGEDRVAVTVQFTATHRRWADACKELQIDFGHQDKPAMGFTGKCKLFARPPEVIPLKMRTFTYSDPVR